MQWPLDIGTSYPDRFQTFDEMIYISSDRNRTSDGEILLARFSEECMAHRKRTAALSK